MQPWETFSQPPREWQAQVLPIAMDSCKEGRHGVISAVMGSGKTRVEAELCRQALNGLSPEFVVVMTAPTIKLVEQSHREFIKHFHCGCFYTHAHQLDAQAIICCAKSAPALAIALAEQGRFVALWIADEAHQTESGTIVEAAARFAPWASVGFSATPFLSDAKRRLRHFNELLFEYSAQQAIQDGVIVPPVLVHYDGNAKDADEAVIEMLRCEEGPGIVNAKDISDAVAFADRLRAKGYQASAIHSRQSKRVQEQLLGSLRDGALQILVDVKLLTEGVDLPYLRWMALRYPITSRVAFCQRVGRALRAYPGKESANILDPHDLFNHHGLTYQAMLGLEPPSQPDDIESVALELRKECKEPVEEMRKPVFYDRLSSYLRRVTLALYAHGYSTQSIKSKRWRSDIPSDKQIEAVAKAADALRYVREPHATILAEAVAASEACIFAQLLKGDVSDLLDILFTVRRLRHFPRLETLKEDAE